MPGQVWQPRLLCRNRTFLSWICVPIELLTTFLNSAALLSPLILFQCYFSRVSKFIVILLVYGLVLMQAI